MFSEDNAEIGGGDVWVNLASLDDVGFSTFIIRHLLFAIDNEGAETELYIVSDNTGTYEATFGVSAYVGPAKEFFPFNEDVITCHDLEEGCIKIAEDHTLSISVSPENEDAPRKVARRRTGSFAPGYGPNAIDPETLLNQLREQLIELLTELVALLEERLQSVS